MSFMKGAQGGYEADVPAGHALLFEPGGQVSGLFE